MIRYVAFLRGINVGGNKIISMIELANHFELAGFKNVKTILNSGNVVFESKEISDSSIVKKIEKAIRDNFSFDVVVQIRKLAEIQKMVEKNPFQEYASDKDIHCYVTFLDDYKGKLPSVKSDSFKLLSIQDNALFSILYKQKGKTTDAMAFLDKTFGKKVTTRNWNTLVKIAHL